jgi:glutaredoxin
VTAPALPRVVLYSRAGCHLCDEARAVVARVCDETGVPWAEVDVDDPPAPGAPDLVEAYGERVPVVAVDGVDVAQWHVSEHAVRSLLRAALA